MSNSNSNKNLLNHWLENLVGTSNSFSVNLFITVSFGLLYSFKVLTSPYVLLLFGVISPVLFTICLYFFIRNSKGEFLNEPFPMIFISRAGNKLLMTFDICLIIGFALLIHFGQLNYFIFRFLQTVFFPTMLLVFLRILFISQDSQSNNGERNDNSIR